MPKIAEALSHDEITRLPPGCEAALGHRVPDAQAACRRGDLFDRRVPLMDAWARQCDGATPDEASPHTTRENCHAEPAYPRSTHVLNGPGGSTTGGAHAATAPP